MTPSSRASMKVTVFVCGCKTEPRSIILSNVITQKSHRKLHVKLCLVSSNVCTVFSAELHYSVTGYEHHQRPSSQQVVDVVQHDRSRLNLLYTILPAIRTPPTNTTEGRAHNNSTTCCTTNSPATNKNLPHPNILTCRDVGLWYCDVANLL